MRATQITRHRDQSADPRDEDFHAVGSDPSWSESYYFYYFDPQREVGGYTRLGFRPHDGWRDAVHMLYLGGSRIAFCYEREPHEADEREVACAGSRLALHEPFGHWRLDFEGSAQDCPDGRVLVTPRKQRPAGWCREGRARLALDYRGLGAPFYTARAGGGGHFEHFATASGELQLGEERWPFRGFGLRDKSWGPRPWTDATGAELRHASAREQFGEGDGWRVYGSWLTGVFHPRLAFALGGSPTRDGGMTAQGFLMRDGRNHQVVELELETDYADDALFQSDCRLRARFEDGTRLVATGEVLGNGPSKIPHGPGAATIVNAAMTRFRLDSGECGLGITEYHSSVTRSRA